MRGHSASKTRVNALMLPGIYVLLFCVASKDVMAGTSPAMTRRVCRSLRQLELAGLAFLLLRGLRNAHVGTSHALDLGDRVVRKIDRRMRLADSLLVRPGHEAERLAFFQVHVRGMAEGMKLLGRDLERIELGEELFLGELLAGEAAFALVVGVDEVLHVMFLSVACG